MELCVFIHYSGANIREKSFLECLQQPLFKLYRKGQPFNGNHLRPCPMLENPELLFLSAHTLYNRFCAKRDQAVRDCFDTLQMEFNAEYDE